MNFNKHLKLVGTHSMFPASEPAWLNYDDDKVIRRWTAKKAAMRGTEDHEFAAHCIRLGRKLAGDDTVSLYVNDCVGYRMRPEVVLSPFEDNLMFGTADAISFNENTNELRIFDLKTGISKVRMEQLIIYAGLFCLEYDVDPASISIELRIYQNGEYTMCSPDIDTMTHVMDKIIHVHRIVQKLEAEQYEYDV